MRADRLVSLVLLLRQRGRMSASALAQELEVSTRTVLRDIEALSNAGILVYAERGRHGGFELLPGFRTELTGLGPDEAIALLAAGSSGSGGPFGLSAPLASAMRKVVDALPSGLLASADDAAQSLLIEPPRDLLSRKQPVDAVDTRIMTAVRSAVLEGRKLRIHYAAVNREPAWRTLDPIGLVSARGIGYLLATAAGADRTYRLSRILSAAVQNEPAERPDGVDLEQLWAERSARFREGGEQLGVRMRMRQERWEELLATALAVTIESRDEEGWMLVEASFQDERHALWALWQLEADAEALTPAQLRKALGSRALKVARNCARPIGTSA